jgi:hypothetical protein
MAALAIDVLFAFTTENNKRIDWKIKWFKKETV